MALEEEKNTTPVVLFVSKTHTFVELTTEANKPRHEPPIRSLLVLLLLLHVFTHTLSPSFVYDLVSF